MAIDEDLESCGSRAVESLSTAGHPRHHRQKFEVYSEVLRRILDLNYDDATLPGFDDQLWLHFNRLPARYYLVSLQIPSSFYILLCFAFVIFL